MSNWIKAALVVAGTATWLVVSTVLFIMFWVWILVGF